MATIKDVTIKALPFLQQRSMAVIWIISILLNIGMIIDIAFFFPAATESIIVHYSVVTALFIDGSVQSLYRLPVIGAVLLLTNTILASSIYQNIKRTIAIVMIIAGLAVQLGLWLALITIHFIN